jgi:hypothetical protein
LNLEETMRSFINVSASALVLGSCLIALPAAAADVTLDAGPGLKWVTPTSPNGNPVIPFKKGDVLIVRQADTNMSHGFRFSGAAPSIPLCDPAPPAGTVLCQVSGYNRSFTKLASGANARAEILRLTALENLAADMPFECVVHGGGMKGTLKKAP